MIYTLGGPPHTDPLAVKLLDNRLFTNASLKHSYGVKWTRPFNIINIGITTLYVGHLFKILIFLKSSEYLKVEK